MLIVRTKEFFVLACTCGIVFSGMLFSGCGHHGEVSFQTDGVTQTIRQGQIALRAGFPLPVYPHAQPSGSVSATSSQDHEDDKFLMLFTADDLDKVESFYKDALEKDGWSIKGRQTFPNMVNMTAQKADQEAAVMLTRNSNKTTINLSVSRIEGAAPQPSTPATTRTQANASNKLNTPDD